MAVNPERDKLLEAEKERLEKEQAEVARRGREAMDIIDGKRPALTKEEINALIPPSGGMPARLVIPAAAPVHHETREMEPKETPKEEGYTTRDIRPRRKGRHAEHEEE